MYVILERVFGKANAETTEKSLVERVRTALEPVGATINKLTFPSDFSKTRSLISAILSSKSVVPDKFIALNTLSLIAYKEFYSKLTSNFFTSLNPIFNVF